jgi:hypothetical protein
VSSQNRPGWYLLDGAFRLVIGRSRVRIPPRAPKPQVRGHSWRCWLFSRDRRSFLWVAHGAAGALRPLRFVGVRRFNRTPVDGSPSSAHSGWNCGGRTIGPALRAGRAFARNRETNLRLRRHPTFRGRAWTPLGGLDYSPTRPGAGAISVVPGHVGQASCTSVDLPVGPWPGRGGHSRAVARTARCFCSS